MALHELSQKELEKRLKQAREKGGVTKIGDGSNLYLVVRADGGASWQLNYSFAGSQKTYSMGTYPKVSLSTARTLAQQARELLQFGKDPVAERKKAREAPKEGKTVAELVGAWLNMNKPTWSATHYDDFDIATKRDIYPYIGTKDVASVTNEDIRNILERVEKRGANYKLTRVRAILVRSFDYGIDKGWIDSNPAQRVKRSGFTAHVEQHHPALKSPEDVSQLLVKLDAEEATLPILALRLNALVFVRPQNLRSASWDQFNLDEGVWTIPKGLMKMNREFLVPLARQTVDLLRNIHTITGHQELLFPSPRGGMYGDTTFMKNLHRLGYKGKHSTHGFRTTAKTLLEEGGFQTKVVEKQLAHEEQNKVERAYNRAEYWPERVRMMQAWADYLDAVKQKPHNPWTWFAQWQARQSTDQSLSKPSSTHDQS